MMDTRKPRRPEPVTHRCTVCRCWHTTAIAERADMACRRCDAPLERRERR